MNAQVETEDHLDTDNELVKQIRDHIELMEDIGDEREGLNSRKKLSLAALKNKGVPEEAITWALKYRDASEEKQKCMDLAYMFVRKAIDRPMQLDMLQETNVAFNLQEMVRGTEEETADNVHSIRPGDEEEGQEEAVE